MADISESTSELLSQLRNPDGDSPFEDDEGDTSHAEWSAQVKLFARTQYAFYVGFQTLVLALAAAVATALVIFVVLAINGVDVTNVAGIVGSLAVGAATGFLQKQASDALGRYNDALGVLSANPA